MDRIKPNTKTLLLALDAACAWTMTAGAALVLLPALGLQAPFWATAVAAAILLAVFALAEARPLPVLITLLGGAMLALALVLLLGRWDDAAAAISGYASWALAESLLGGAAPQLPVYIVSCAPIALAFWLLMRLVPSLWAVAAVSVGLIAYKAVCMPEGWMPPYLLLCAGLILFLPRASLKGGGRLRAQALAAALAVPVLGLAVLLCPSENGQWQSVGLRHLVQDCQDLWEFHFGDLPELPVTSMHSMGLQPDSARLGGDIQPGDATVVSGDKQLLLRGQVLDTYTGSAWEDSGEGSGNFRLNSFMWQLRRQEAFGLGLPKPVSKPLLRDMLTDVRAELSAVRPTRSMFLPYRTRQIYAPENGRELYFDMEGEVYWDRQSGGIYRYTVVSGAWNFRAQGFDRRMLMFEEALEGEFADDALPGIEAQYLQLPDSLPEGVRSLARDLTAQAASPYAKAMALRDYLSGDEFTYTLTPGDPDPEEDFVAAFLANKQGYCTYYASALTVLCRAAGVPARYATGYAMVPDGDRYVARESTAHAWTEVYIANTGWVPLDALGMDIFGDEPEYGAAIPDELLTGPAATPTPTPAADIEPVIPVPEEEGGTPAMAAIPALVLLALAAAVVYRRGQSRRFREEYVLRRFPDPAEAAGHCSAGLLRLLRLMGIQPQGGETLLVFWQRAAERFPEDELGRDLSDTGRVLDRLRYGGIPPTREELRMLCRAYAALEAQARRARGVLGWLIV